MDYKKHSFFLKAIAAVIIVSFLWSNVAWAMPNVRSQFLAAGSQVAQLGQGLSRIPAIGELIFKGNFLKDLGINTLRDIVEHMDELEQAGVICFARPDQKDETKTARYVFSETGVFLRITKKEEEINDDFYELLEATGRKETVGKDVFEWFYVTEHKVALINSFLSKLNSNWIIKPASATGQLRAVNSMFVISGSDKSQHKVSVKPTKGTKLREAGSVIFAGGVALASLVDIWQWFLRLSLEDKIFSGTWVVAGIILISKVILAKKKKAKENLIRAQAVKPQSWRFEINESKASELISVYKSGYGGDFTRPFVDHTTRGAYLHIDPMAVRVWVIDKAEYNRTSLPKFEDGLPVSEAELEHEIALGQILRPYGNLKGMELWEQIFGFFKENSHLIDAAISVLTANSKKVPAGEVWLHILNISKTEPEKGVRELFVSYFEKEWQELGEAISKGDVSLNQGVINALAKLNILSEGLRTYGFSGAKDVPYAYNVVKDRSFQEKITEVGKGGIEFLGSESRDRRPGAAKARVREKHTHRIYGVDSSDVMADFNRNMPEKIALEYNRKFFGEDVKTWLITNPFPIFTNHFQMITQENTRQNMGLGLLRTTLEFIREWDSDNLTGFFNPIGANASQNHSHIQFFPEYDFDMGLDTVQMKEIFNYGDSVKVSLIEDDNFPVTGFVFDPIESKNPVHLDLLAIVVQTFLEDIMVRDIPYNIVFRNRKVYVFPRNPLPVSEFGQSFAGAEMVGHMLLTTKELLYIPWIQNHPRVMNLKKYNQIQEELQQGIDVEANRRIIEDYIRQAVEHISLNDARDAFRRVCLGVDTPQFQNLLEDLELVEIILEKRYMQLNELKDELLKTSDVYVMLILLRAIIDLQDPAKKKYKALYTQIKEVIERKELDLAAKQLLLDILELEREGKDAGKLRSLLEDTNKRYLLDFGVEDYIAEKDYNELITFILSMGNSLSDRFAEFCGSVTKFAIGNGPDRVTDVSIPSGLENFNQIDLGKVIIKAKDVYGFVISEALNKIQDIYSNRLKQIIGFVSSYINDPPLEADIIVEPVQVGRPSIWYELRTNTIHIQVILLSDIVPLEYTYFIAYHGFIVRAYQKVLVEDKAAELNGKFLNDNPDIKTVLVYTYLSEDIPIEPMPEWQDAIADINYARALYDKYKSHSKRLLIIGEGENFKPSALLKPDEREELLGAKDYSSEIAGKKEYLEAAKGVHLVANPMDGGIGANVDRTESLEKIWGEIGRTGPVKMGAKGTDLYFDAELTCYDEKGKVELKPVKVSVTELKYLHLLYTAGQYGSITIQELVNDESRESVQAFLQTIYLPDRIDQRSDTPKRTYAKFIKESGNIEITEDIVQASLPTIDLLTNKLTTEATEPGGHGHLATINLQEAESRQLPEKPVLIHAVYNGDGTNNFPDAYIVGWMAKDRVPIVMISTTKTGIDKKGGIIGIEYLKNGKCRIQMCEEAQAKESDSENPGQLKLFYNMGLTEGEEGEQYFNTNIALINYSVLGPFLRDLKKYLESDKYLNSVKEPVTFVQIFTPDLMDKSVVKDGKTFRKLEGALGNTLLNLDAFTRTTDDERVKEIMKNHGIEKLLRIVNVDETQRTNFFTPIKVSFDYWLQAHSDHFKVNTKEWRLENRRPGHLPAVDEKLQRDNNYYMKVTNCLDAFGNASTINLDYISITGKVKLRDAILKGKVDIVSEYSEVFDLNSEEARRQLGQEGEQPLILENVEIQINPKGEITIKSTPKAASLSRKVDTTKKETVYYSVGIDINGNILPDTASVREAARSDDRFNEAEIQRMLKELLRYLRDSFGEGIFGPIEEIVIVDNLGGIDSDMPPEQRGAAMYFLGKKMIIDIDEIKDLWHIVLINSFLEKINNVWRMNGTISPGAVAIPEFPDDDIISRFETESSRSPMIPDKVGRKKGEDDVNYPMLYNFYSGAIRREKRGRFVVQLNPPRKDKEPSAYNPDRGLRQPYTEDGFHFENDNSKGKMNIFPCEIVSDYLSFAGVNVRIRFNINPFAEGHFLIIPEPKAKHPQYIGDKKRFIDVAIAVVNSSKKDNLKVCFNSMGGFGSVNHFHFQGFYYGEGDKRWTKRTGGKLPVETAGREEIFRDGGITVSKIKDYPANGIVFKGSDKKLLSEWVFTYIRTLCDNNIPHNILFTKEEVIVFPRRFEFANQFGAGTAVLEMSGEFIIFDENRLKEINENDIEQELEKTTISEDVFADTIKSLKKSLGLLEDFNKKTVMRRLVDLWLLLKGMKVIGLDIDEYYKSIDRRKPENCPFILQFNPQKAKFRASDKKVIDVIPKDSINPKMPGLIKNSKANNQLGPYLEESIIGGVSVQPTQSPAPLAKGHLVIYPDYNEQSPHPQVLTENAVKVALGMLENVPVEEHLKIGFNSWGAWGSVNLLHIQPMFYEDIDGKPAEMVVETYKTNLLFDVNGVSVKELVGYPVYGFVLEDREIADLTSVVFAVVKMLQKKNTPHNLIFTKGKGDIYRVYLFPRKPQAPSKFGTGVAFFELGGELVVLKKAKFEFTADDFNAKLLLKQLKTDLDLDIFSKFSPENIVKIFNYEIGDDENKNKNLAGIIVDGFNLLMHEKEKNNPGGGEQLRRKILTVLSSAVNQDVIANELIPYDEIEGRDVWDELAAVSLDNEQFGSLIKEFKTGQRYFLGMAKIAKEAQELVDFLDDKNGEQAKNGVGTDNFSIKDVNDYNPLILAVGSPSPQAFVGAAQRWHTYTKWWGFDVPVVASTGRGRGYRAFVLNTLRYFEEKEKANALSAKELEVLNEFREKYESEIIEARSKSKDVLFDEYNMVVNHDKKYEEKGISKPTKYAIDTYKKEKLTEAKVIKFIFMSQGVPEDVIYLEEDSYQTHYNMVASDHYIQEAMKEFPEGRKDKPLKIHVVADAFHRLRALLTGIIVYEDGISDPKKGYGKTVSPQKDWKWNAKAFYKPDLNEMDGDALLVYLEHMIGESDGLIEDGKGRIVHGEIGRLSWEGKRVPAKFIDEAGIEHCYMERFEFIKDSITKNFKPEIMDNLRTVLLRNYRDVVEEKKKMDFLSKYAAGVSGILFWPEYRFEQGKPLSMEIIGRLKAKNPDIGRKALETAKNKEQEVSITGHLRGLDGCGSSLDLPEFQKALTPDNVANLGEIPSTPTISSEFNVKIRFELAENPEAIEYIAPDYGIFEGNPYEIVGDINLENNRTPEGQMDAPAYIFRNIFGLKGIRIICESISPMAKAGGMESSNVFNVALIAGASMLSKANLSLADIFSLAVKLENDEFGGLTGGQGHLCTMVGGAYRHIWLSGIKDKDGNLLYPYGAFSMPLLSEVDLKKLQEHMLLVQAGKEYEGGNAKVGRTAALINNMWTDLLRDKDPIGLQLHGEKLALTRQYTEALRNGDFNTVVKTINRYVDIRDELCGRWINLMLDANESKPDTPEYAKVYAGKVFDTNNKDYKDYEVIRKYKGQKPLRDVSFYTLDPIGSLVKAARKEGIAIMPLGAGGPGANLIAISDKGTEHIKKFLQRQGINELTETEANGIIAGTGTLKGYMDFRVGKESLEFNGFKELCLDVPELQWHGQSSAEQNKVSHLLPKYLYDEFRAELIKQGLTDEANADSFIAQISYTDANGVVHIAEGLNNEMAVQIMAEVLGNVLNRPITKEDVLSVLQMHEQVHQIIREYNIDIVGILDQLKAYFNNDETKLIEFLYNFARSYNYSADNPLVLVEELMVHTIIERYLFGQPVKLIDTKGRVVPFVKEVEMLLFRYISSEWTHNKQDIVEELDTLWKKMYKRVPNNYFATTERKEVGKFVLQFNPERGRKRASESKVDKVYEEFGKPNFNFCKWFILKDKFALEPFFSIPHIIRGILADVLDSPKPLTKGHFLLLPRMADRLPQYLTVDAILSALGILEKIPYDEHLKVAFNSWGAWGSVNHLHLQAIFYENKGGIPSMMPVEKANEVPIAEIDNGITISSLENWPVKTFVFSGRDVTKLANAVIKAVEILQQKNIAHNLIFTKTQENGFKVYLFPRQFQKPSKFGTGVAFFELGGELVVLKKASYEFIIDDIENWEILFMGLKGGNTTIFQRLSNKTQGLITQWQEGQQISGTLKEAIIDDLNRIMHEAEKTSVGEGERIRQQIIDEFKGAFSEVQKVLISYDEIAEEDIKRELSDVSLDEGEFGSLEEKIKETLFELALIERHLDKAKANPDVPPSIVDINKYIKDERFIDRWFFYELPAEVFVEDYWGRFLTKEEKKLRELFLNIGTSKVPERKTKIKDFLSTNEMEALFLDIMRAILGEERFGEIITQVKNWNNELDDKASREYDRLKKEGKISTQKQKIKASILSEIIASGEKEKDEYFRTQIKSGDSIKIDDRDKFIQQLEKLTGSAGQHYLHVVSHHGAVIFDLEIFAQDIIKEWLEKNIKGFDKIDWKDTEAVRKKLDEARIQIKDQFRVTFAVKDKRIAPTDVTIDELEEILKGKRFGLLKVFREFGLFGIVNTGSQTRGMNLNDASEEFVQALEDATLIGIKGGDNTITARLLNKDHFVFGTSIGYGIQRYTGLRFRREAGQIPAGFMAFIPSGIPAASEVQFSVPPRQNLGQFVVARRKLEEDKISYDMVKERMDRGDTFVEAVYPEVLGDTDGAKKALRGIRDVADSESIPFLRAIEVYVEKAAPRDIKKAMFDYTVLELNRAFNERIAKRLFAGKKGSYCRASYVLREKKGVKSDKGDYIGEEISDRDAYQKAGENRVLVNILRLTKEAFSKGLFELGGVQASDHDLGLIAPEKVAKDEFRDRSGIIVNFLYFFTDRLRKEFNMRAEQAGLEDKPFITGSYVGFQKDQKTGEVFAPLYNKGAIAVFKDGRIEFGRVRLGTGRLTIADTNEIPWVPFDQVKEGTEPEAIAYTPMFDGNLEENGVTHFGNSKETRRILTPDDEKRINIVIFRNRITQIREGCAEIPPAGWVLSVRKDIFEEIKKGLKESLTKSKDKDKSGKEHFVIADEVKLKFDYDLPKGWEGAYWIMGGATLTYNYKEGRMPISKVMEEEGWNYNSSRQTQETDLSNVSSRGPRQILCQTMDGDFCIFTFSGRSDMSGGVTHDEALDVIIKELEKEGKGLAYALNLDGGSSVCMGVAQKGRFYPLNISGKGDNGTCDVRPVNGVAFIRSIPKAASLSRKIDTTKKETVYYSMKMDMEGNILPDTASVREAARNDDRFNEAEIQKMLKELLQYLRDSFGEGIFGPIEEIVIVDNLGGIDSDMPPEQRGGATYFLGKKMIIDIDVFQDKSLMALKDVGAHESFEAILELVEKNPAIREVTATYCALNALRELTRTRPQDLDSYIEFLKQEDNGLDSLDYALFLETIRNRMDSLKRDDLIALSIGYVLNTPRYKHLEDSLRGVLVVDVEEAKSRLELARNIYKDIVVAKRDVVNKLRTPLKPIIDKAVLAKAKMKIRMLVSSLAVKRIGFAEALIDKNKYIRLDVAEMDKAVKGENTVIKEWLMNLTTSMQVPEGKRSPFVLFSSNKDYLVEQFIRDNGLDNNKFITDAELGSVSREDVITVLDLGSALQAGLPQNSLSLPLIYSVSSIYLAGQIVLAGGDLEALKEKDLLAYTTLMSVYGAIFGNEFNEDMLRKIIFGSLPEIAPIIGVLNELRKAIIEIEKAA